MVYSKCKICRRQGEKLFLKGEKCSSQKCPIIRRPFPPGQKKKRRTRALSEYGKELREKQKLRNWYNLGERQFVKYVKEILQKIGRVEDAPTLLIKKLENRFDNVIFRFGLSVNRSQARQLISHKHFVINGKPVNAPSYQVKKGDKIGIKQSSGKKNVFKDLPTSLKKNKTPNWLEFDIKKMEGTVIGEPTLEEAAPPSEISTIFEYYSR